MDKELGSTLDFEKFLGAERVPHGNISRQSGLFKRVLDGVGLFFFSPHPTTFSPHFLSLNSESSKTQLNSQDRRSTTCVVPTGTQKFLLDFYPPYPPPQTINRGVWSTIINRNRLVGGLNGKSSHFKKKKRENTSDINSNTNVL